MTTTLRKKVILMNNSQFVSKLKDIANNHKTLYVMGCFGAPLTSANKIRYTNNHEYNRKNNRSAMIKNSSADTFGFDCVGLIKGVLWGWNGATDKIYGGAEYASKGVPDINADTMIAKCSTISTDFSTIEIGEAVWIPGHIGVYIGDGKVVECSPQWKNGVQITSKRKWQKHGKLPYITYSSKGEATVSVELNVLRSASRGEQVKTLQRLLVGFGFDLKIDGVFGTMTDRAVRTFQRKNSLSADGVVGEKTWHKLLGA